MWRMLKFSVKISWKTDPNSVCELMDCLATVFMDKFSKFFQHFLSFCWCLVTLNVRHLQLTLNQPSNTNAIQKPLSSLKYVFQRSREAFHRFGSEFSELHAKLDAHTLLDFAIHHRQNETRRQKSSLQKQCVFAAQCHMAD
jgi:hypothetical protein